MFSPLFYSYIFKTCPRELQRMLYQEQHEVISDESHPVFITQFSPCNDVYQAFSALQTEVDTDVLVVVVFVS